MLSLLILNGYMTRNSIFWTHFFPLFHLSKSHKGQLEQTRDRAKLAGIYWLTAEALLNVGHTDKKAPGKTFNTQQTGSYSVLILFKGESNE